MAKLYRQVTDSSSFTVPRVFARVRHADGLLVEYLEHRPSPDDVDRPGL